MGLGALLQADLRQIDRPSPEGERRGLSEAQAQRNRKKYGQNLLPKPRRRSRLKVFLGQYKDVLTLILLAATAISLLLGEWTDAVTIGVLVLCNGILGYLQEHKAEKTLEALEALSAPMALVLRDGAPRRIPAGEVTVGDLLLLEAGDRVAADGVLIQCAGLCTEESVLTGEAQSMPKQSGGDVSSENALHQKNRVYMGTTVSAGRGQALVTHIGAATQMGAIAGMLGQVQSPPTPLQKRLGELGKWIAIGCAAVCALVSLLGLLRGEESLNMLLTGLSLAVAAVPEGLPAIVTISLALAVKRMVRQNALVRSLPSVEALGTVDVICTDKTGTLTQNRMKLNAVYDLQKLTGVKAVLSPAGKRLIGLSAACTNCMRTPQGWQGDPTEIALAEQAEALGMGGSGKRVEEAPFDSVRRRMSVSLRRGEGEILICKGALEAVLPLCTRWGEADAPLGEENRRAALSAAEIMSGRGLRVLAAAYRENPAGTLVEEDLIFLGLVGLEDPPRPEAKQAVEQCRKGGIKTIMITGDHALTAKAVARQVGIPADKVVTGAQLENMEQKKLEKLVQTHSVFARVSPAHKLRIVQALQKSGRRAAMTGDGVNDAPAIRQAEVGVAMGQSGTDVTRQAADLVLLDDNFATLAAAVREGRVIYQNIRKFIRYLISCNIGEVLCMLFCMVLGWPVMLLPIQILFVNLLTDGLPAMALGLDPADTDVMSRPPRRPDEGVFSGGLGFAVAVRGAAIALAALGSFSTLWGMTGDLTCARTAALFTLILTQLMNVFECKSETLPFWKIPLWNNKKLLLAAASSLCMLILVMSVPCLQAVFQTTALPPKGLLWCLVLSLFPTLLGMLTRRK